MIYSTDCIERERVNKDSRRVLKMLGALLNEDSVLVFREKGTREKEKLKE